MGERKNIFGDFHIHIGRTEAGEAVKITGARNLTFANVIAHGSGDKGIDMIGIIDAASRGVQREIAALLDAGTVTPVDGGGLRYERTTIVLGCELEIMPPGHGPMHLLCYFPTFDDIRAFRAFLERYMKNTQLSTQRFHGGVSELFSAVHELNGIVIPAHVFTPFKSLYGSCADRLTDVLPAEQIIAVELGLSSDSLMADQLAELHSLAFLSNSDAHSLPKIGREYNELAVNSVSFHGWVEALKRENGARVVANYGLDPRLGKYHRTLCKTCERQLAEVAAVCPYCGSRHVIQGVRDRIAALGQHHGDSPRDRPPYIYQVPLEFIPGVGPRALQKLLDQFGTEMNIIHRATEEELAGVVGEKIARRIVRARYSELAIEDGGGGVYGKVNV
ncbi:endonuclease Q family protein [Numidum massiliense]|uniref:endonuclease Q family protein n=1 Tax=Numidum massiliense TaxID=1522315 RepID=UPI0009E7607C|nr:endonuclease Q family protein [Numidum massiliense]